MVEKFFKRPPRSLPPELEVERKRIEALAKAQGLDIFETVFEMCDYDEINMLAAYGGFPTRYPHWRWGMEFLQMQKGYEYGLQKIYEMVINTNPSYAYLLDNNLFVDQKLVEGKKHNVTHLTAARQKAIAEEKAKNETPAT